MGRSTRLSPSLTYVFRTASLNVLPFGRTCPLHEVTLLTWSFSRLTAQFSLKSSSGASTIKMTRFLLQTKRPIPARRAPTLKNGIKNLCKLIKKCSSRLFWCVHSFFTVSASSLQFYCSMIPEPTSQTHRRLTNSEMNLYKYRQRTISTSSPFLTSDAKQSPIWLRESLQRRLERHSISRMTSPQRRKIKSGGRMNGLRSKLPRCSLIFSQANKVSAVKRLTPWFARLISNMTYFLPPLCSFHCHCLSFSGLFVVWLGFIWLLGHEARRRVFVMSSSGP